MKPTIRTAVLATVLAGMTGAAALPVLAQDMPAPPNGEAAPQSRQAPAARDQGPGWPRLDFKSFDSNADGTVSLAEVQEKRKATVAALDANGDGKLGAEELINDEIRRLRPGIEARVAARIAAQDADGDGLLSAAELATAPGPEQAFRRFDSNGDGEITPEEMRAAHKHMAERFERARDGKADGPRGERGEGHGPRRDHDARSKDGNGPGRDGRGPGPDGQPPSSRPPLPTDAPPAEGTAPGDGDTN